MQVKYFPLFHQTANMHETTHNKKGKCAVVVEALHQRLGRTSACSLTLPCLRKAIARPQGRLLGHAAVATAGGPQGGAQKIIYHVLYPI